MQEARISAGYDVTKMYLSPLETSSGEVFIQVIIT